MEPNQVFWTTPRAIIRYCLRKGNDVSTLLDLIGFSSIEAITPDSMLSLKSTSSLWEHALRLTGSSSIGAEVAMSVPFGAFRAIDFLFLCSPSPLIGMQKTAEYYPLINTGFRLTCQTSKTRFEAFLESPDDPELLTPQYVDYLFSLVMYRVQLASPHVKPVKVLLKSRKDSGIPSALYQKLLTKEKSNALIFDVTTLNLPQLGSDSELFELLCENCEKRKRREYAPEQEYIDDLLLMVKDGLAKGRFSLVDTANQLSVAPRTLQRKLLLHGTSYREIVDRVRRNLVADELSHDRITFRYITDILGYAESKSFYRAFKRWYGTSFSEFMEKRHEDSSTF